jgi:hypothetical protein
VCGGGGPAAEREQYQNGKGGQAKADRHGISRV